MNYEEGEKSSIFFFSQEKSKGKSKLWRQIKDSKGNIKTKINDILEVQSQYYSELMSSEGWDENAAQSLLANIKTFIPDTEREICEKEISENELNNSILKLKLDKSPGLDGIPAEFYKKYWHIIKSKFIKVIREIEKTESLCISQYRGVICLLFKSGDREKIINWRPITLLNVDYKIIATTYASRLKKILPQIINDDQRAYIEGRHITENIRLTQDIISYSDEKNIPGAIIFLDQKKAYDRVEWGYLKLCLEKFGFGPRFCNWVMMLYKFGESCIQTNGFLSSFFKLGRSMRQGCPIAASLYVLQAEPLAESIRQSKKIKGIRLPGKNCDEEVKISMFADDTQLFLTTEASITESFEMLQLYCKASGAELNYQKTKGLYIGQWKDKKNNFDKIKWVKQVEGLGAVYGYGINYEELWMQKFFKFKKKIDNWKGRDLSLRGKKLLINSYILSSVSFLAEIYTADIPTLFISETKKLICNFIWGSNTWRVSQETLGLKREQGGLEIHDINNFINSKKLKWIIKIHFSELKKWNAIGKYFLKCQDDVFGIEDFIMECSCINGLNVKLPKFYNTCLEIWYHVKKKEKIVSQKFFLNQNIFGNCNIQDKRQHAVFYSHWTQSNLVKIHHLWNENTNTWKSGEEIYKSLKNKRNWIAEYNKIKDCIPMKWKSLLQDNIEFSDVHNLLENPRTIRLSHVNINVNNEIISYKKLKQKDLYYICLYPCKPPSSVQSWNATLEENIVISDIFKKCCHPIFNRKSLDFHWKILHRCVFTESKLKLMKKSDGICKLCNENIETITHLLYDCVHVKPVWENIQKLLDSIVDCNIMLDISDIIFGVKANDNLDSTESIMINLIIFIAKWYIWKHRNDHRYGNIPIRKSDEMYRIIIKKCNVEVNTFLNSKYANKNTTEFIVQIRDLEETLNSN